MASTSKKRPKPDSQADTEHNEHELLAFGIAALWAELDEMVRARQQLIEQFSAQSSKINHKLRNHLHSILALSGFLQEHPNGELTSEQEKQINFIHQAGEDLLKVITSLPGLSPLEIEGKAIHPTDFKVSRLFSALECLIGYLRPQAVVQLIMEDYSRLPSLHTDQQIVWQILRLLISQALYLAKEGEVRVSADLNWEAEAIVFSVAWTGESSDRATQADLLESQAGNKPPSSLAQAPSVDQAGKLACLLGGELYPTKCQPEGRVGFSVLIPINYKASPPAACRQENHRRKVEAASSRLNKRQKNHRCKVEAASSRLKKRQDGASTLFSDRLPAKDSSFDQKRGA